MSLLDCLRKCVKIPRIISAKNCLISIFIISLAISVIFVFPSSPTYIIVEPDAINESFEGTGGASDVIKTLSIKNLGDDRIELDIGVMGNRITDTRSLVSQLSTATHIIYHDVSSIEKIKAIDKNSAKSINTTIVDIQKNIQYLNSSISNLSAIFKNISIDIRNINNDINSIENETNLLNETTDSHNKTSILNLINDSKVQLASINADITQYGAISVSLSHSPKIKSGETEFVLVEIDPSLATTNGEYNGAIIIEADNKKLHKVVPISFKIKGTTIGSAELKSNDSKSIATNNTTLNLTGSLGS